MLTVMDQPAHPDPRSSQPADAKAAAADGIAAAARDKDTLEAVGEAVALDELSIRRALSEFTTGVTIVATEDQGERVGFACQSFSSLSLDPPMVLFTVMKSSRSWPHIRKTGRFSVNVLSAEQEEISAAFGRRGGPKFAVGQWQTSARGNPLLHGSVVWFDCEIADVFPGGDHYIVTANIVAIGRRDDTAPLIDPRGSSAQVLHPGHDAPSGQQWRQRPSV